LGQGLCWAGFGFERFLSAVLVWRAPKGRSTDFFLSRGRKGGEGGVVLGPAGAEQGTPIFFSPPQPFCVFRRIVRRKVEFLFGLLHDVRAGVKPSAGPRPQFWARV